MWRVIFRANRFLHSDASFAWCLFYFQPQLRQTDFTCQGGAKHFLFLPHRNDSFQLVTVSLVWVVPRHLAVSNSQFGLRSAACYTDRCLEASSTAKLPFCVFHFLCLWSGRDVTATQMEGRMDTRPESLGANCGVTLLYAHKGPQEEQFEGKPGPDHGEHKGNGCTLCRLCPV